MSYETGIKRLLEWLGSGHPRYAEALTLQARLSENIAQTRRYGDNETRRTDRAQIVDSLNCLALETVGMSFNELSVQEVDVAQGTTTPPEKFTRLREKLIRHFDKEDLRTLCSNIGVDYDDLPGEGKTAKARELIAYLDRRGRIPALIEMCTSLRLHVSWEEAQQQQPIISTDGSVVADDRLRPPLSEFDPSFLENLEAPGGAVTLSDKLYIERDADAQLKHQVARSAKSRTATIIRAPRQTGKTSLLIRGICHAHEHGAKAIHFDMQRIDRSCLETLDVFLHYLAELIVRKLQLNLAKVGESWRSPLGPRDKLTYLMEDYILPESGAPIILAMDEVDLLLQTPFYNDFFALLRSWFNSGAYDDRWSKFSTVMVISTEPYLLIADLNQSPFNVGFELRLEDFNEEQVRELNRRHNSPVKEDDFPELMKLLNGHPYLTRQAFYTLVVKHRQLTWGGLASIAHTDHGPFGGHLRHHYQLLCKDPSLKKALKQVIANNHCADNMALVRLLQAGLVKESGGVYMCRCDLYRMYFEDRL